ncbi:hypothetical protein [uncultured Porphyromonas sp.]|uniref:hypothetical protein n=1 Tax=uncultured Porphyromonas sp. TaxID=159274 RepID=UPI002634783C|nr:hypothetical protein [uncultured Porphyromonas sp.]
MQAMIQRFFHPVGQGAFYSERHLYPNINTVYDCGTRYGTRNQKGVAGVVRQSFRKDDIVHILFISHFDFDHISLIDTLKNSVNKIERVVIPLLQEPEKTFLSNIYKFLGEPHLANLVSNPSEFFGRETQIIRVHSGSEQEFEERRDPIDVSEGNETTQKIPSGTPLTMNGLNDWVYIPFNYEYQSRREEFLEKLNVASLDIDRLEKDPNYILEKVIRDKVKKVYKSISGGINQNSMFLYSGPSSIKDSNRLYWRGRCWHYDPYCWYFDHYVHRCNPHRVACLYTGDGDLNEVKVKAIYSNYWDFIGTIQIPQHGSLSSFDASILDNRQCLCPISVGKNNYYGHPSQEVISEILLNKSCPLLVTEDVDSTFVETIKY